VETSKLKDTVNKRALFGALIPFAISVLVLAGLYYNFFIRKAQPQAVHIATGVPGSASHELMEAIGNQLQINNRDIAGAYWRHGLL